MTSYFIGGALGSLLSGYAYHQYGWIGVSSAGAIIGLLGLLVWLFGYKNDPVIQSES